MRRATPADLPGIARIHRLAFFAAMPHMPVLHTPKEDQRSGFGCALLEAATAQSNELRVWTFQCNTTARCFYEKHGFTAERFTARKNDERQPDVLYVWRRVTDPRAMSVRESPENARPAK